MEIGIRCPSDDSWPDGIVRLLAWRSWTTCWLEMLAAASLAGSSVTSTCCSSPPVRSTSATPSTDWTSGTISVRAILAASASPSALVAAIDATTTGDELMLNADTWGVTLAGRPARARFSWIDATVSLTSVPKLNWATTSAIELADVDWRLSSRATPEIDRSIGLVTCSATSSAPTPG